MEQDKLEQSDAMICNTKAYATFYHKKQNDLSFYQSVFNSTPKPWLDIDTDTLLKMGGRDPRECLLSPAMLSRGGNAVSCRPERLPCGPERFKDTRDFLLDPCPDNTYRNHVVCDAEKCCSVRHQTFMNVTKRK
jgi:hypothetical protein